MNKLEGGNSNLTQRGRGRPKGSQNKVSKSAKETIAEAAEKLGGMDRIVKWAKEAPDNEKAFWVTIYPKIVALNIDANVKTDLSPEMKKWLGKA